MTKFLKADNGEILTAGTDLIKWHPPPPPTRGKKHSGEMITGRPRTVSPVIYRNRIEVW
jgi:hypothetical protein